MKSIAVLWFPSLKSQSSSHFQNTPIPGGFARFMICKSPFADFCDAGMNIWKVLRAGATPLPSASSECLNMNSLVLANINSSF
ncbi:unnamed protein product [Linum trigynum]|uniref:Uncharacterized protein n=1 Tax=Linum trigynum TaxID=586398 RepID=A0AAV2FB23_9ROSI